jgi:NADPH-dependent glutamate synthase beta subunit-like oxidoreductase
MMKLGIPDFRLPKEKLAAEIGVIEGRGGDPPQQPGEIRRDLQKQGFQAYSWEPEPGRLNP